MELFCMERPAKMAKQTAPAEPTMKLCIERLMARENLSDNDVSTVFQGICKGEAEPTQISAFLVLLGAKGETAEEVTAIVRVMREHAVRVKTQGPLLDIVGTGGDGANTVNISTSAAVLLAACGVKVAKHGNRSVSSKSGSADVLETLGVPMLQPAGIPPCVENAGIAFMFAPHFHPAMKYVVPVRKALKVRTIFNILGPLLNPAMATRLVIGVYTPTILETCATVLHNLGAEHALVMHCAGLDELWPGAGVKAECIEVTQEKGLVRMVIDPAECGVPPCTVEDLKGGDADDNAKIIREVFAGGEGCENAVGNTIAFNAAAGLYVYGKAASIADGYKQAKEVLKSGAAATVLAKWSEVSKGLV